MITPKVPGYSLQKTRPGLVLLLLLLFFNTPALLGQKNEIGVFFGGSYYLGELNPGRQFAMTRIALGGIYRYNFGPHISARLNGIFASVEGNDALIKYNEDRNLRFVSKVTELSGQIEINFLPFVAGNLDTPYSPFIFGGGGIFGFSPQAQNEEGRWVNLRPLNTEGQGSELYPERKPYGRISSNYLFGIGLKFNISRNITGGVEWGMRRTGTDYLDDVSTTYADPAVFAGTDNEILSQYFYDRSLSHRGENTGLQRGDPSTNDWYSFAGFVIAFKIKDFTRGKCPAYN